MCKVNLLVPSERRINQMLKGLFGGVSAGRKAGKAIHVLVKTYDLIITGDKEHTERILEMSHLFGDAYNEHDLACYFLSEFCRKFDPSNERQIQLTKKYVTRAKGAYNRGLIENESAFISLSVSVNSHFGIEIEDIPAI